MTIVFVAAIAIVLVALFVPRRTADTNAPASSPSIAASLIRDAQPLPNIPHDRKIDLVRQRLQAIEDERTLASAIADLSGNDIKGS